MRAVVQRVTKASVTVRSDAGEPEVVGQIGKGLLMLVAVEPGDGEADASALAEKISGLRCFERSSS